MEVAARAMVDMPDKVVVTETPVRGATMVELTVAQATPARSSAGRVGLPRRFALWWPPPRTTTASGRRSRFAIPSRRAVPDAWDDLVLVGRIVRTHGHRGAVIVHPDTDFPEERFVPGAKMWIARAGVPVEMTIVDAWMHNGRPVVTLEGVDSMDDAERCGASNCGCLRARCSRCPTGRSTTSS